MYCVLFPQAKMPSELKAKTKANIKKKVEENPLEKEKKKEKKKEKEKETEKENYSDTEYISAPNIGDGTPNSKKKGKQKQEKP